MQLIYDWMTRHRNSTVIATSFMFLCVATLDYVMHPTLAFSLLYLLPVLLSTWVLGRRSGFVFVMLGLVCWGGNEWLGDYPYPTIGHLAWNTLIRLWLLLMFVFLLCKLRAAMDQAYSEARFDSLTQIANRRYFLEQLPAEINRTHRHCKPFTLLYLDVDNFKTVNDSMGHAEGDKALRMLAEELRTGARLTDLPARLGGDEFVVLLPETSLNDARRIVHRIKYQIDERIQRAQWPISVSVGAVTFVSPQGSVDDVIHSADRAMYKAKTQGKNRIVFLEIDSLKVATTPLADKIPRTKA